ncbi:MAG: hypothetical protein M1379_02720 [Firmicutes bacterium]|nr:hypothetical protein [Bacillota bacterium]
MSGNIFNTGKRAFAPLAEKLIPLQKVSLLLQKLFADQSFARSSVKIGLPSHTSSVT